MKCLFVIFLIYIYIYIYISCKEFCTQRSKFNCDIDLSSEMQLINEFYGIFSPNNYIVLHYHNPIHIIMQTS